MEVWTVKDMTNPQLFEDLKKDCENIWDKVRLEFTDGAIICGKRWAFINLLWFPILTEFGIPLCKRHFIKYQPFDKKGLTKELNKYYDEIMNADPPYKDAAQRLKNAVFAMHTRLYYFGYNELAPYVPSFDIIDLAEITHDPAVKPIVDAVGKIDGTWSTKSIEKLVADKNKELQKTLATKGLVKNQSLQSFQRVGQLNPHQIYQTLLTFGTRTDVNDRMINRPVYGSSIDGLRDIEDFAIESLSAKKSMYYNKSAIQNSQYFNRRVQLIASIIAHVYSGDCGSTQTTDFLVSDGTEGHPDVRDNIIGMYIIDHGKQVLLTRANIDNYVGKVVQLRSPLTCKYTTGVCEKCMGAIGKNIHHHMNPGILAAIKTISQITQKILSAKHLIKTNSIAYELNANSAKVFQMTNTADIYWQAPVVRTLVAANGKIGVAVEDLAGFDDIQTLRADKTVEIARISQVHKVYIKSDHSKDVNVVLDMVHGTMVPSLTTDMLFFIREHLDKIEVSDNIYWIPIAGTEKLPILASLIVNDDMISFVNSAMQFFSKQIDTYSTNADCLAGATKLIYSKASVHLAHLTTVLKAFQVTNPALRDYRVPVVTDTNNVKFAKEAAILTNRTIGGKLAYQELFDFFSDPSTYITPKQQSELDWMVGYTN